MVILLAFAHRHHQKSPTHSRTWLGLSFALTTMAGSNSSGPNYRNGLLILINIGLLVVVILNLTSSSRIIDLESQLAAQKLSFGATGPVKDDNNSNSPSLALEREKQRNVDLKARIQELESKLSASETTVAAVTNNVRQLEQEVANAKTLTNDPQQVNKDDTATTASVSSTDCNNNNNNNNNNASVVMIPKNDSNDILPPPFDQKRSAMCGALPSVIPSTLHLWNSYLDRVVMASKHENDKSYRTHDYTTELLHLISPDKIDRSIVGVPHQWGNVRRVMTKVWERYQYVTTKQQQQQGSTADGGEEKPRVKILVMGGSLIVGVNCRKIIKEYRMGYLLPNRLCTWTHRLETFLNKMLVADVFEVQKVALGGTNTETGHVLLEQDFIPEEAKDADILINAYSTNDMHILTMIEAKQNGVTLRDRIMEMTQNFVRTAMKDGDCAPLLLHMDDYLGNEQREIMVTMELSQAVQTLSAYYGFAAMSYANVVRDIVYGDTHEGWFSPSGWYEGDEMVREIHPNMGMHIVSSWVVAYNMLNIGLTYCTIEPYLTQKQNKDTTEEKVQYEAIAPLPALRRRPHQQDIGFKPKGRPYGLPPVLEESLSLENVTALWKAAPPLQRLTDGETCPHNVGPKCPLSWFSGLTKEGLNVTIAEWMFVRDAYKNTGWGVDQNGKKMGISPKDDGTDAANKAEPKILQLLVPQLQHDVTALTLFYMKSYGEKWDGSRIRFSVEARPGNTNDESKDGSGFVSVRDPDELVGYHGKNTSETYTHRIKLDGIGAGKDVLIGLELIGGTTFKMMGIALCK